MSKPAPWWVEIARETVWNNGEYDEGLMDEVCSSAGCTVREMIAELETPPPSGEE